jgi:hypothetical protein
MYVIFSLRVSGGAILQIYEDHVQATIFSFKHNKTIDDYDYKNLIKECGDDSLPFARIRRIACEKAHQPIRFRNDARKMDYIRTCNQAMTRGEESECSDGASDVSDECRLPEIWQETQTRA